MNGNSFKFQKIFFLKNRKDKKFLYNKKTKKKSYQTIKK